MEQPLAWYCTVGCSSEYFTQLTDGQTGDMGCSFTINILQVLRIGTTTDIVVELLFHKINILMTFLAVIIPRML